MRLHRIDPKPSSVIDRACAQSEVAAQTVRATLDLYLRKGYIQPWVGYLAESDDCIVGGCGFAGPPVGGEAEIAYFTFPEHEGKGVASAMAAQLIEVTRQIRSDCALIAHTLPVESASTAILRKLGFVLVGTIEHPEDGPVWKWSQSVASE